MYVEMPRVRAKESRRRYIPIYASMTLHCIKLSTTLAALTEGAAKTEAERSAAAQAKQVTSTVAESMEPEEKCQTL